MATIFFGAVRSQDSSEFNCLLAASASASLSPLHSLPFRKSHEIQTAMDVPCTVLPCDASILTRDILFATHLNLNQFLVVSVSPSKQKIQKHLQNHTQIINWHTTVHTSVPPLDAPPLSLPTIATAQRHG